MHTTTSATSMQPSGHRVAGTASIGAVLFVLVWTLMLGRPVHRSDEAWFLWVADRTSHGAVLYRDVYYVSTPLAAWLGTAVARVGGASLLAIRALPTAIFVGEVLVAWAIARRAGLGVAGRVILELGLVLYASPLAYFESVYSGLAILCALGAFGLVLAIVDRLRDGRPVAGPIVWAGIVCGLALASKPNTGLAATAAVAVTLLVALREPRQARRALAQVLGAVAGVALVVVVVVVASGGWSGFVDQVLLDKGGYVRVMSRGGPLPSLGHSLTLLPGASNGRTSTASRWFVTVRFLPIIAGVVMLVAALRGRGWDAARTAASVAFFFVALASGFPRLGPQHLAEMSPLLLTVVAVVITTARTTRAGTRVGHFTHATVVLLTAVLGFGALAVVERAARGLDGRNGVPAAPPHLRGSPVRASRETTLVTQLRRLRRMTGGTVFIVRADAAFYYLAGDLRDPTPYDYPTLSDFGRSGEQAAIRLVDAGRVRYACIHTASAPPPDHLDLRPRHLEHAIETHFRAVARFEFCRLYRFRGRLRPPPASHLAQAGV
jgi:hypothetical protein